MKPGGARAAAGPSALALSVLALAALALAALAVAGCDYLEKGRIERACRQAQSGLQRGDAAAYLAFLAPEYQSEYIPLEAAKARLAARLKEDPRPKVSFGKLVVDPSGDRAVVTESFTLEARVEGRTMRYDEVQHLVLERRASGWQCLSGSKLLALLGGQMEDEHAIEETMLRREAALVGKDIHAYMDLVSPDYRQEDEGPEQLKEKLVNIFRVFDNIEFRSFDRKIYYLGTVANVEEQFNLTALKMGKPESITGKERFELTKTDDGWKFTKGFK
jgi:ketosteroid isomerase-like protein